MKIHQSQIILIFNLKSLSRFASYDGDYKKFEYNRKDVLLCERMFHKDEEVTYYSLF